MITIKLPCPLCGFSLLIEEQVVTYAIMHNGQAVTTCPNCQIPLRVEDGELIEDPASGGMEDES